MRATIPNLIALFRDPHLDIQRAVAFLLGELAKHGQSCQDTAKSANCDTKWRFGPPFAQPFHSLSNCYKMKIFGFEQQYPLCLENW